MFARPRELYPRIIILCLACLFLEPFQAGPDHVIRESCHLSRVVWDYSSNCLVEVMTLQRLNIGVTNTGEQRKPIANKYRKGTMKSTHNGVSPGVGTGRKTYARTHARPPHRE